MRRLLGIVFGMAVLCAPLAARAQTEAIDLFRLGAQELAAGMHDKAIATLERAVSLKADAKEGWYNLGVAYGRKKAYAKEIQSYQRALELDPNYVSALHNLGMAQLDLGRKEDGIAALKKAVELAPDAADSWNNLGIALMDSGDLPGAMEALRKLVELTPESPEALFNLGIVLMRLAEKETSTARQEPLLREALQEMGRTDLIGN
ncbi:MAG TPA: tetratricopeptide repeat protein, partial [Myxococcota bacterium]|nr:tetratricopeptide repeat protein [Myxococcota bacterium]